jgi:hypothetical protein
MALAPPISRRDSAANVDRQDGDCIFIEDHWVAANAETIAAAALKRLHVALARHGVAVKPDFHLLASVSGKDIEILRGAQREDDRFHERYYRSNGVPSSDKIACFVALAEIGYSSLRSPMS